MLRPRLSELEAEFASIQRGDFAAGRRSTDQGASDYQRIWLLNQLMYRIERAWNVVPMYDETGFREKYPDVYDLYMRIRNARYTKEVVKVWQRPNTTTKSESRSTAVR